VPHRSTRGRTRGRGNLPNFRPAPRDEPFVEQKKRMPPIIININMPGFISDQSPLPYYALVNRADEQLGEKIARLAAQWRIETGHLSSIERKVIHPAYQTILATGKRGIPYVLRELKEHGGQWFWALHFMSGGVDFDEVHGMNELRNSWLAWGKSEGYPAL
jgi:hypothetical protein